VQAADSQMPKEIPWRFRNNRKRRWINRYNPNQLAELPDWCPALSLGNPMKDRRMPFVSPANQWKR